MKIDVQDLKFIDEWFYEPQYFKDIMTRWKPEYQSENGTVYLLPILKCVYKCGRWGGFVNNTYVLAKEVAIVDKNIYEKVAKVPWRLHSGGYAIAASSVLEKMGVLESAPKGLIYLHRVVLGVVGDKTLLVDHVDNNRLDNRMVNLRLCDYRSNNTNVKSQKASTSKYRGVSWYKESCKWMVRYRKDGKKVHVGYYNSEEEAALAYDNAVRENIEDLSFHTFNFPEEGEQSALQED